MSWTKRTNDKGLLHAAVPGWFAEAVAAGTPKPRMLERLHAFSVDAENAVAAHENRPARKDPPSTAAMEAMYKLYLRILNGAHGA